MQPYFLKKKTFIIIKDNNTPNKAELSAVSCCELHVAVTSLKSTYLCVSFANAQMQNAVYTT